MDQVQTTKHVDYSDMMFLAVLITIISVITLAFLILTFSFSQLRSSSPPPTDNSPTQDVSDFV
jgi:hypothetical protein